MSMSDKLQTGKLSSPSKHDNVIGPPSVEQRIRGSPEACPPERGSQCGLRDKSSEGAPRVEGQPEWDGCGQTKLLNNHLSRRYPGEEIKKFPRPDATEDPATPSLRFGH